MTNSVTEQFSPGNKDDAGDILTGYTTGTDYVSFGQRSAGYIGNRYEWSEIRESLWEDSHENNQTYPYHGGISKKITSHESSDYNRELEIYEGLDRVDPGDVIYYVLSGNGSSISRKGAHLMVVADVNYDEFTI